MSRCWPGPRACAAVQLAFCGHRRPGRRRVDDLEAGQVHGRSAGVLELDELIRRRCAAGHDLADEQRGGRPGDRRRPGDPDGPGGRRERQARQRKQDEDERERGTPGATHRVTSRRAGRRGRPVLATRARQRIASQPAGARPRSPRAHQRLTAHSPPARRPLGGALDYHARDSFHRRDRGPSQEDRPRRGAPPLPRRASPGRGRIRRGRGPPRGRRDPGRRPTPCDTPPPGHAAGRRATRPGRCPPRIPTRPINRPTSGPTSGLCPSSCAAGR